MATPAEQVAALMPEVVAAAVALRSGHDFAAPLAAALERIAVVASTTRADVGQLADDNTVELNGAVAPE